MYHRHRYPHIIIKQAVYHKLRFSLSYLDVEELMSIRGVKVDHSTVQRWVFKFPKEMESLHRTLAGIEIIHMIRKDQILNPKTSAFKTFCSLAA